MNHQITKLVSSNLIYFLCCTLMNFVIFYSLVTFQWWHVERFGTQAKTMSTKHSSTSIPIFFTAFFTACTACSAAPLIAGWLGGAHVWLIPLLLQNSWNSWTVNWGPLSTNSTGNPKLARKTHSALIVQFTVGLRTRTASIHLECTSILVGLLFQHGLHEPIAWGYWPKANQWCFWWQTPMCRTHFTTNHQLLYNLVYLVPPHIAMNQQFHLDYAQMGKM